MWLELVDAVMRRKQHSTLDIEACVICQIVVDVGCLGAETISRQQLLQIFSGCCWRVGGTVREGTTVTYVESETLMNKQQVGRTKVVFETSWALETEVEGFREHNATDGSLNGVTGRDAAIKMCRSAGDPRQSGRAVPKL